MADMIHGMLVLLGLILLVFGVRLFATSRQFLKNGIKTHAVVRDNLSFESNSRNSTSILYAPLLAYEVNGKETTYVPNARSNPPAYAIGEHIAIVYSPRNPQHARIISFWGIYLGSNILFILGWPMFLLGAGYFLFKYGWL
ncbi:DUF3592 domain-containing protein [Sphingobacterium suaedae]|uniref:DUF3592 domain-containing protein n=2 Tax=Sphingobacterium suaedae TaxID=1686402 RepID=A0ABW5KPZ4_9SPHI